MTGSRCRVKGIKRYASGGKHYCYHRATGARIDEEFGSAAFFVRLKEIEDTAKAKKAKEKIPQRLGEPIDAFQHSTYYRNELKPSTQRSYRETLALLSSIHEMPLHQIDTPFLASMRDKIQISGSGWNSNWHILSISVAEIVIISQKICAI